MKEKLSSPITGRPADSPARDVGIWIRVSSEDQAKGESPEHHLERAQAYAKHKGWKVKEVYDLAGVSGKTVLQHPECQRMLADIKRGHITGLIFSKLARLARNTKESIEISEHFQRHGADLISLRDNIDTTTPAGRMFFTFQAAQDQWEREEIAERQKASVLIRAKLGKSINGRAPYGYQWKERKLVVQPDEAPVRRKAFELFLKYHRKGTVTRMLNAAGHRSRQGALWCDRQVDRLLTCPSAKGTYYFNRLDKQSSWRGVEKPREEWGCVQCEPIVPAETWEQVNRILEEQTKAYKRPGKLPTHTFGRLAWCQCGGKMYVRTDMPKYICRKCCRKIPSGDLDAIVREELHAFFGETVRVEGHLAEARRNRSAKEQELATLQRQVTAVRDEMKQTHRLYLEGAVTAKGFGEFYRPAEERLNQLLAEVPRLEAEVASHQASDLSVDAVVREARSLYDQWPKLGAEEKRRIAEAMLEKITIGEDNGQPTIELSLSYLPTSEEPCKTMQQIAYEGCQDAAGWWSGNGVLKALGSFPGASG